MIRRLDEQEMDVYRRPYLNAGEHRRPGLNWVAKRAFTSFRRIPLTKIGRAVAAWLRDLL